MNDRKKCAMENKAENDPTRDSIVKVKESG